VSEIESIDGEMEIFCVQKTHRALAALVQLAGLEFVVGYDCSTGETIRRQGYCGRTDRHVLRENALGLVRPVGGFHSGRHRLRGRRDPHHDGLRAVLRLVARLPHGARHLAGQLGRP
jgi:hypothetical protein